VADTAIAQKRSQRGWRDGPGWRLANYDPTAYPDGPPPDRPSNEAERANPPIWASRYVNHRPVATWFKDVARTAALAGPIPREGGKTR
jgi:hypothetical protein